METSPLFCLVFRAIARFWALCRESPSSTLLLEESLLPRVYSAALFMKVQPWFLVRNANFGVEAARKLTVPEHRDAHSGSARSVWKSTVPTTVVIDSNKYGVCLGATWLIPQSRPGHGTGRLACEGHDSGRPKQRPWSLNLWRPR